MNLEQLKEAQDLADRMQGLHRQIDLINDAREGKSISHVSIFGAGDIIKDGKRGNREELTKIRSSELMDKIVTSAVWLIDAELQSVRSRLIALGVKV